MWLSLNAPGTVLNPVSLLVLVSENSLAVLWFGKACECILLSSQCCGIASTK